MRWEVLYFACDLNFEEARIWHHAEVRGVLPVNRFRGASDDVDGVLSESGRSPDAALYHISANPPWDHHTRTPWDVRRLRFVHAPPGKHAFDASVRLRLRLRVRVCGCAGVRVCGCAGVRVCGVRCAVCGVRCAVCGVRCAVCGVRCAVCGVGCGVWGVGCGVWGVGCGVWGVGCGVWGVGCGVGVWVWWRWGWGWGWRVVVGGAGEGGGGGEGWWLVGWVGGWVERRGRERVKGRSRVWEWVGCERQTLRVWPAPVCACECTPLERGPFFSSRF